MKMAANSNMNFHPHHLHPHHNYHPATTSTSSSAAAAASGGAGVFPASFYNDQYVVCFQSGAINSSDGMMMMRGESSSPSNKSSSAPAAVAAPPSPLAAVGSMVAGLKHDTGLAVDWSFHEQALLNDALIKFAGEPGTMKYIKIAALLPDKTVRDVALRCRWMSKKEHVKRRKIEENYAAKKILNRKEQMLNSHMKGNIHSLQPVSIVAHSFMLHPSNQNNQFSYEAPVIDGATQQLMEENVQIISQISDNLSAFKLQDNIDLFSRTSKNITDILNRMSEMPGIMSKMPPLPVSIDEDLMNYILPIASQAPMFGMPSGMSMKLEPR